jgi:hypothetical protein
MVERVMTESDARGGGACTDLGPEDARALLRAWLAAVELDLPESDLIAYLQADGFSHAGLDRRARRAHERKLEAAVANVLRGHPATGTVPVAQQGQSPLHGGDGPLGATLGLFEACVPAIPYAPAAAFLGREKRKLARRGTEPRMWPIAASRALADATSTLRAQEKPPFPAASQEPSAGLGPATPSLRSNVRCPAGS